MTRNTATTLTRGALSLALIASITACSAPSGAPIMGGLTVLSFVNGGFESGNTSGWTITANLNTGITVFPPAQVSDLHLQTGGALLTSAKTGAPESMIPFGLTSADSLRYPKYGQWAAEVNTQSSTTYSHGQNANSLTQTMITTSADVDPTDGNIHVRFALAPVLQNPSPAHANTQQPYFYVEIRNVTKNQQLFSAFNFVNQTGVPWKSNAAATVQYTDWQAFDVAPGPTKIAVGDSVAVTAVAAGCSPGGHFGVLYLDAFGAFLPGVSVAASAPAAANAGGNLTYTFIAGNGGTASAGNAIVTENLPANTTFVSLNAPGATCTTPAVGGTGAVVCNVGTLNPSASYSFGVTVKIAAAATGTIANGNYTIKSDASSSLIGPLVQTTITAGVSYADLALTLSDGVAAVGWGTPVTYTLVASNNGPSAVSGATLTESFPAQLTNVVWSCSPAGGASCGAAGGAGNISTTVNLPVGGTATYTIAANVVAGSGSAQLSTTALIAVPAGFSDSVTSNNTAIDVDGIGTLRTVTVDKGGSTGTGTVISSPSAISCGTACSGTTGQFVDGTTISFTASAATGATFQGWSGPCTGIGVCTFLVSGDVTLGAIFVLPTFIVSGSVPGGNGTITCPSPVVLGQSTTCTVTPASGYALSSFSDNGIDATAAVIGGSYVLTNVSVAHPLLAAFKEVNGVGCAAATDCGSGICVDGVCCDTACTGQCEACDVAGHLGTCSPATGAPHASRAACNGVGTCGGQCDGTIRTACAYPTNQCVTPQCVAGTATTAASCDGAGSCATPAHTACGAYGCGATSCNSSCGSDDACATGSYCQAGSCLPRHSAGAACGSDDACTSAHCIDGVCCDTACNGQCAACNLPGSVGTCSAVTGAPVGARPSCGSGVCAGSCDGTQQIACSYPTSLCAAPSCVGGIASAPSACDGTGLCSPILAVSCEPYGCDTSACKTHCTGRTDCAPDAYCSEGQCLIQQALGNACGSGVECASGNCSSGVCCDTACSGSCLACNLASHVGLCTPLATGVSCMAQGCSAGLVTSASLCDGAGSCIAGSVAACAYGCSGAACASPPPPDMSILPDLSVAPPPADMTMRVDMTTRADLTTFHPPSPDLLAAPDLAQPPADLALPRADLAKAPADLALASTDFANTTSDLAHTTPDLANTTPDLANTTADFAQAPTDLAPTPGYLDVAVPPDLTAPVTPPDSVPRQSLSGGGFGCQVSGATNYSTGWSALLVFLFVAALRRRRALMPALAIAGVGLAGPRTASALGEGFALSRFEPSPAGQPFFFVDHPWYSSTRWFAGGLSFNYAHDPLVSTTQKGDAVIATDEIVRHQLTAHVDLAASAFDRATLSFSLPVTLVERGTSADGIAALGGSQVGDPRIGLSLRMLGHPDRDIVHVSLAGYLWIPVGTAADHTGDASPRGALRLILGGRAHPHVRWTANVTGLFRAVASLPGQAVAQAGPELQLAAQVSYVGLRDRLSIGPEVNASFSLSQAAEADPRSVELLVVSAHYRVADQVAIGVGAGFGILREPGTPDARALLQIAYAPRRN